MDGEIIMIFFWVVSHDGVLGCVLKGRKKDPFCRTCLVLKHTHRDLLHNSYCTAGLNSMHCLAARAR